ncbi:MAG: hypothetical protein AAB875_07655 [Patescibacteria group bacterium]
MTEKPMNGGMLEKRIEDERQKILRAHQYAVTAGTPQERRISALIKRELLSTEWARKTFADIRELLIAYFKDSLLNTQNSQYVHDRTQRLLSEVAERGKTKIVSGEEHLGAVPKKSPVFLMTNHLGLYKLATINPEPELGLDDFGAEKMFPLPLFHASNKPVADALGDGLYIGAFEFPGKVGQIQKTAGGVVIRLAEEENLTSDGTSGIDYLTHQTKGFIERYPNGALSVLPEGGTSGKRNGGGPYSLETFRTGAFVIAARLSIPILPVPQYFNPQKGFEVAVLEPIYPNKDMNREEFTEMANLTREKMQKWLDERKGR